MRTAVAGRVSSGGRFAFLSTVASDGVLRGTED